MNRCAYATSTCYVLDSFVCGTIPFLGVLGMVGFVLGPAKLVEVNWIAYIAFCAIIVATGLISDEIAKRCSVPHFERGGLSTFLRMLPISVLIGFMIAVTAVLMPLISAIILFLFRLFGYPC